jgi:hypothetical protein
MTITRQFSLTIFFTLATLIPGPVLYVAYKAATARWDYAAALFYQRINISIVIASFAFTMLGFLAAIITVLFSLGGTKAFRKYSSHSYLELFLYFYFFSLICLMLTFGLSIFGFAKQGSPLLFKLMIMSAVNNLVQISLIAYVIINMANRASGEP